MPKLKSVKWKCSPATKSPPKWVKEATGLTTKAEIAAKFGRAVFVKDGPLPPAKASAQTPAPQSS